MRDTGFNKVHRKATSFRARISRRVWIALIGICATLGLAACGSSSSGGSGASGGSGSKSPLRVAFIAPLSGPAASYGIQVEDGMKIAIAQVNAHGGVLGRKLTLETYDSQANPATAVSLFRKAQQAGPIALLYPGLTSGETLAVAPLAARAGVLSMNSAASSALNSPKKVPLYLAVTSGPVGANLVVAALKKQHLTKVGLLYDNGEYGTTASAYYKQALQAAGITISDSESFAITDTTFTSQLAKIKSSGAQALVFDATGAAAFSIMANANTVGLNVPFFAGQAVVPDILDGAVPANVLARTTLVDYAISSTSALSNPHVVAFRKSLTADGINLTKTDMYLPAQGYDQIELFAAAAKAAHSVSSKAVYDTLRSRTWPKAGNAWLCYDYKWPADSNFVTPGPGDVLLTKAARDSQGLHKPLS